MTTTATGSTKGSSLAVGAVLALTVANHQVEASISRDVAAPNGVTLQSTGVSATTATSTASAAGAKGEGEDPSGTSVKR